MLISLSMSTWIKDGNKTDTHTPLCQILSIEIYRSFNFIKYAGRQYHSQNSESMQVFYLQIGCEWVRKPHVAWEGTEDEVAKLDAVRWDHITEAIMVVTQELWEVMQ